ncbi:hypothetical protein SAMN05660831_01988 [Thiohalospira halophila DSM 15071]|jgi:hypothetical protein|uniref:Uncharacterized protein n=1 Tax=Thiohalospira halophila DSM 15071 TaxID=1123397 RepID=A0A1I1TSM2_9GAMM|nr:hypothetical protein [Thiohalospira halophila]SFD61375.1 hypothetical protein SAMN05660831_01988 [Thiohalospira halophila DSM 15071]
MADDYRPALADYFDELEARYADANGDFSFDSLSDEELLKIEELARHAIYEDGQVTTQEKLNLQPLLDLVGKQRAKRGLPPATH